MVYENVRMITKFADRAYFSNITEANIYESFTHKMAAKANWHRHYATVTLCVRCTARHNTEATVT